MSSGMYKFVSDAAPPPDDALEFVRTVNTFKNASLFASTFKSTVELPSVGAVDLFTWNNEMAIARAPGRLDVMGGIADYSGSLVLQLPIQEATFVALERSNDRAIKVFSPGGDQRRHEFFEMQLDQFLNAGKPIGYDE